MEKNRADICGLFIVAMIVSASSAFPWNVIPRDATVRTDFKNDRESKLHPWGNIVM